MLIADEQFMKLQCLAYAPEVIKKCTVISETRMIKKRIKGKLKDGVHYELIHLVKPGEKIGVIIEKIGTGKHKFLSIIRYKKRHRTKKHL